MSRRAFQSRVAANVSRAIDVAGFSRSVVAEAADLTVADLTARLDGEVEFEVPELVEVGGFLCIRPSAFLTGAAA